MGKKYDPMKPSATLLVKLGSAIVHAEEFMSKDGHEMDKHAFDGTMTDPEVEAWMAAMDSLALLPKKRR